MANLTEVATYREKESRREPRHEPGGLGTEPVGIVSRDDRKGQCPMLSFEEVKAATDLQAYCEAHLEGRGRNTFVCPSCGSGNGKHRTPAFTVLGERFKCFSCNASGDIFDLAGILNDTTDKQEQLRLVAEWAGIADTGEPPAKKQEKPKQQRADYGEGRKREAAYVEDMRGNIRNPEAVEYLASRGIMAAEAEALGFGYDPQRKSLVIPWKGSSYYHVDRDTTGRAPHKYSKPRSADVGSQPLYNPDALKQPAFFVVEGALDAAAVELCGYEAVALGGTGARAAVEAMRARRTSGTAIVLLDSDEAGQKAAAELCGMLRASGIDTMSAKTETKDACEWLQADRDGLRAFLTGVYGTALDSAQERREEAYNKAMRSLQAMNPADVVQSLYLLEDTRDPLPTGFAKLDAVLGGGLQQGLYILGALSSLGKTTLALQVADHVAQSGYPVLFVSVEQSARELVAKSLSRIASACGQDFAASDIMSARARDAWGEGQYSRLSEACSTYTSEVAPYLRIYESTKQPTVEDVRTVALLMAEHYGTAPVVIVDYLQLLATTNDRDTDKRAMDRNVSSLRILSKSLDVPVLVISSLNRSSYSEGVTMDAFKESGAIEYSADVLLGLQPSGMYDHMKDVADKKQKREADEFIRACKAQPVRRYEVAVLKNRNGMTPDKPIQFTFKPKASTFREA